MQNLMGTIKLHAERKSEPESLMEKILLLVVLGGLASCFWFDKELGHREDVWMVFG